MLLNDKEITRLATEQGMISPFIPELVRKTENGTRIISAGLSSFGYDLRADYTFKVFRTSILFPLAEKNYRHPASKEIAEIDPKNITASDMVALPIWRDSNGEFVRIPPKTFALCHSIETINLPPDVTGLITSKSTYARSGLQVTTTVGEAGWSGQYVLELFNPLDFPFRVYIGEGVCQLLFLRGNERADVSYADRNGKYQNQTGITLPIV